MAPTFVTYRPAELLEGEPTSYPAIVVRSGSKKLVEQRYKLDAAGAQVLDARGSPVLERVETSVPTADLLVFTLGGRFPPAWPVMGVEVGYGPGMYYPNTPAEMALVSAPATAIPVVTDPPALASAPATAIPLVTDPPAQ